MRTVGVYEQLLLLLYACTITVHYAVKPLYYGRSIRRYRPCNCKRQQSRLVDFFLFYLSTAENSLYRKNLLVPSDSVIGRCYRVRISVAYRNDNMSDVEMTPA